MHILLIGVPTVDPGNTGKDYISQLAKECLDVPSADDSSSGMKQLTGELLNCFIYGFGCSLKVCVYYDY